MSVEPYDDPAEQDVPPETPAASTSLGLQIGQQLQSIEQKMDYLLSMREQLDQTTATTNGNTQNIARIDKHIDHLQGQIDSLRTESLKRPTEPPRKEKPWWLKRGSEH